MYRIICLSVIIFAGMIHAQVFGGGPARSVRRGAGSPPSGECSATSDVGKVYINSDASAGSDKFFHCRNNGGTVAWANTGSGGGGGGGGNSLAKQTFAQSATSATITHNWGLSDPQATITQCRLDATPDQDMLVNSVDPQANSVTVSFAPAASGGYCIANGSTAGGGGGGAHASSHQHGGSDEVATAAPGANAIPKAGGGGTLDSGWIPDLSATYVPVTRTLTGGSGIAAIGDLSANRTISTASGETDFLAAGALACGAGTRGRMQIHSTPLQYCDDAATPALRYASYGDSSGAALTGDSAAGFFTAGQIEAARGGTGIDTSALTGVPRINAGAWSADAGIAHLAASSSANLRAVLTDENGGGVALFDSAANPTFLDLTIDDVLSFAESAGDATCGAGDYWIKGNSTNNKLRGCENGSTFDVNTVAGASSWSSLSSPTAATNFVSDATGETADFQFQASFTSGNQYAIRQNTGNPTGGTVFAVVAADADPVLSLFQRAIDGAAVLVTVDNSQANAAASTNETADIRATFAGSEAGLLRWGKTEDYTSSANESSFFAIHTRTDGTTAEAVRFLLNGVVDIPTGLRISGSATSGRYLRGNGSNFAVSAGAAAGAGSCTNQVARALNDDAAPTCVTITSSYVDSSIGLAASPLSQFAATTSAQLAGVLSDETGSGAAVFGTSPTLAGTPVIGDGAGNDKLSFAAESSNPACSAGNYFIWANSSDGSFKKCQNGTVTNLDTGGSGTEVTAAATFANDNRLLRSDGTGRGAQASGVTLDDSSNMTVPGNLTVNGTLEVGDGTVAGETIMRELTANGTEYRSWLAPDALTAIVRLRFANAVPASGQVMRFSAPASDISDATWSDAPGTGSCTNQAVRVLNHNAAPTCVTITSSYVDSSIGVSGSPLSQFAATTSAQLAGVISDETGSGAAVFGTSPTISSPAITNNATFNNYNDWAEIAAPGNPASGNVRVYAKSGSGELCAKSSGGTETCMSAGGGGGSHNILSSTHTDTAAASVVRGDIIVGNSTPAWSRLAIGGSATFLRSNGTDLAYAAISAADLPVRTMRFPLLNGSVLPNSGNSDVYFEPYPILATNDVWHHGVWRFGVSNTAQPTVRSCVAGVFDLPSDIASTVTTANAIFVWTGTGTSGNVVWDFEYRIVGGDDTTSLDQTGTQQSVTVTDAMPGAANRRLVASAALTAGNFSGQANTSMTWQACRDGADANDTAAFSALLHSLLLEVSTQ